MKFYICLACGDKHEIADTAKRRNFCPPCMTKKIKAREGSRIAKLKALRAVATGSTEPGHDKALAKRVNEIAPFSRVETAKMLGITPERVRTIELEIIYKIRKHCGPLAEELGFARRGVFNAVRLSGASTPSGPLKNL